MRRVYAAPAALAVLAALAVVACGGGSATVSRTEQRPVAPSATPTGEAEPLVRPSATAPRVPPPSTEADGAGSWADGYAVGTCFDRADGGRPGDPVDCAGPHENEIFAWFEHPGGGDEPYPADIDALVDEALVATCDPALLAFGGEEATRLPLRRGVWVPTEQEWVAGDRMVACTAQSALAELATMIGTAAGGTLDSAEGIVARATVDGQRDFFFSFEGSALHPLTQGGFDIANTSPHAFGSAFLFSAPRQGGDASRASAYAFDYATGAITELATGAPAGAEVASPHFVRDPAGYVFAARETPDDDWDIYRSTTDGDREPLTENDVDDRWPTLTPDGKRIVFHSEGDIWIMNIDGSDKRRLTDDPAGDYESAVSPDGAKIAFVSDRSGDDEVWLMNLDGSDQVNLSNHPAAEAWPFWSADGTVIYFQTDRLGANATIMMMETDGSNQSYYSYELLTNAALLPAEVTSRFIAELPRLDE